MLFATLGGAVLGLAFGYLLPKHDTYGVLLLPAIGASASAVVWAGLTWLGWKFDGGWIWVVALAAGGVSAGLVGILLGRRRSHGDIEMLGRLSKA
jgi:hypothetical protein